MSARHHLVMRSNFATLRKWMAMTLCLSLFVWASANAAGPVVSIITTSPIAVEGGTNIGVFSVSRSGPTSQPLTIYYRIGGTAQNAVDYQPLPGSVTIPAGQRSAAIQVRPIDDTIEEEDETVEVTLIPNTLPFSLVVLPDTQHYVDNAGQYLDYFSSQIQWIIQHKYSNNIAMVLQEGDCTDGNSFTEWNNFKSQMQRLDGVVPYVLAVGNHDGLNQSFSDTAAFNITFPVTNYQNLPTFGGVFETNRLDNSYHYFSAGGVDWMVLSLEFGPRNAVLDWANQVVTNNPNRRVIIVTHAHLYSDDTLHGSSPTHYWTPTSYGRSNNGTEVWDKLLRLHANICFVFNGHVLNDGAGRLVGVGDHGNNVYQMLANYQSYPNGGNAFLRIVEFDPAQDSFSVKSYSPAQDLFLTNSKQEFDYNNLGIFNPSNIFAYEIDTNRSLATVMIPYNDPDVVRPTIEKIAASGFPPEIAVTFSEPVARSRAERLQNYSITNVTLTQAVLQADLKTVILSSGTQLQANSAYTLKVSGVTDRARVPNVIATNSQKTFTYFRVLLSADFNDNQMEGWTIVDDGIRDGPSNWNVRYGRLEQSANIYGPNALVEDNRLGTYAFWDKPSAFAWSNYIFAVTLRTSDDDGLGVMFRYQNPTNYYKLDMDLQRNFRKLTRFVNGAETLLAMENAGYAQNENLRLTVELTNHLITVFLNDAMLFNGAVADTNLDRGTVALYCWGSAGVTFDDVLITPDEVSVEIPSDTTNNTLVPIPPTIVTLVPIDAFWTLWESDVAPAPGWQGLGFNDSDWSDLKQAIFSNEPDPIPDPKNSDLSLGYISHFFRNRFQFTGSTKGTCLSLKHLIDDGAVFYLNGLEILRTGMPEGPVTASTPAIREVDNAAYEGPFDIEVTNLFVGENVFAVELHQSSVFSEDAVFGVEVDAIIPHPTPISFSSIKSLSGRRVQLGLPGQAGRTYLIETSTNLFHWESMLTLTNTTGAPLFLTLSNTNAPTRFYRGFIPPSSCSER